MRIQWLFLAAALFLIGIGLKAHAEDDNAKWLSAAEAKDNSDALVTNFLALTHPSGSKPKLVTYSASNDGAVDTAIINFTWQGGLTGDQYSTTITWKFDKAQHLSAEVSNDTAVIGVDKAHKQKLNEWFRDSMFPMVK